MRDGADQKVQFCNYLQYLAFYDIQVCFFKHFNCTQQQMGKQDQHSRCCEPGSSVSIVSGYVLQTGRSSFDPRQKEEDFSSSLCAQTGSGAHPASCTMGTGGPFHGGKAWPGRDADHSPSSSAEVVHE
jgi:hypothetical protein